MEPQAALVGAQGAVELVPVAGVGMIVALIVLPDHTEGELPLRLHQTVQQIHFLILGMGVDDRLHAGQHFFHGLDELGLIGMLFSYIFNDACNVSIHNR